MFNIKRTGEDKFVIECDRRDMIALAEIVGTVLNQNHVDETDKDLIEQLSDEIDNQDI